jgi:hypothetical protein
MAEFIFVDVNAEGMRDLLGDADTAEFGISALELNDRRDEFRGRTFGAGFAAMRGGGKEQAVFRHTAKSPQTGGDIEIV